MEWRDNLYQHEETPPKKIWDALANEIKDEPHRLRQDLYLFEAAPPVNTWGSISSALSPTPRKEAQKAPQPVPLYRKMLPYAASVAAACVIAIISIRMSDDTPGKVAAGISALRGSRTSEKNMGTALADSNKTKILSGAHDRDAAIPSEPKQPSPINKSSARPSVVNEFLPTDMALTRKDATASYTLRKPKKLFARVRFHDRNYIRVRDVNGNWSKVNYKLEDMVESLQQKDVPDAARYWESKLSDWQERMGRSTYVPAPGHFFDIIEMASALQKDQ